MATLFTEDENQKLEDTLRLSNLRWTTSIDKLTWTTNGLYLTLPCFQKFFNHTSTLNTATQFKSIKYICKYVNKGSDMAVCELANENTTTDGNTQYKMGRYLSSNEAVWRILNFSIHDRYPTVVHLSVHQENGLVYLTVDNTQERTVQQPNLTQPPDALLSYMSGTTSESKHFLQNLRRYNSCFPMTSFGATATVQESSCLFLKCKAKFITKLDQFFPSLMRIWSFYFMGDEQLEADQRCEIISSPRRNIVLNLQRF